VLVVEDDSSVRETVTLVLERSGFEVTAVADGQAAVAEASRFGAHDLMLLDLMLPRLSGLDVCREIRRSSSLPIVMLTARADTADVVAGFELGADDYVTKPFEPIELAARVRAVLRRRWAVATPPAACCTCATCASTKERSVRFVANANCRSRQRSSACSPSLYATPVSC
jgi:two-component system response regulator MtrA